MGQRGARRTTAAARAGCSIAGTGAAGGGTGCGSGRGNGAIGRRVDGACCAGAAGRGWVAGCAECVVSSR